LVRRRILVGVAVVGASLVAAGSGTSAIVGTTGAAIQIAPPPSVLPTALESNTQMPAFDERQNVTLAAGIPVDITTPGVYDDSSDLTIGTIPAGTQVSSQFVHCDKVGESGQHLILQGAITTNQDILGVAILGPTLDASDAALGAPGTAYPTGDAQRRLNLDAQDDFVIYEVNRRTLIVQCDITSDVDQVRVITAANRAPDCSTVTLSDNLLWPPNHKLKTITASGATDPDGDPVSLVITGVTQDEPVNGLGDGDTSPDAVLTSPASNKVQIRAERSGLFDGRVYHLSFTATDPSGASCTGTLTVGVPHDQGRHDVPIDSAPPSYNSLLP
jgi:hypothetical protein